MVLLEMNIMEYIKPELLCLVAVVVVLGRCFKESRIQDKYIPRILMISSIVLATLWVIATSALETSSEIALAIFTGFVQGILCAGTGIGLHQTFVVQPKKD